MMNVIAIGLVMFWLMCMAWLESHWLGTIVWAVIVVPVLLVAGHFGWLPS